ncbi:hypothetical protein K491DRAFT_664219 [Lophiostoma macrostomum CBS 122681]|uniref:Uncharacterized protein n=1 Tax=Lophiostoma macrostomum CBS 122681 TaxID=1314788 RepID=A0A6A6SX03_9PLEO|nr:hypothetical protein K491DRAFT_664219 [Lophiostoma macrostomum CBS 122681]
MAPGPDLSVLAHELDHPDNATLPHHHTKPKPTTASRGTKVLDPSAITTEFDDLRFEAAAFGQLQLQQNSDHSHGQHDEHSHPTEPTQPSTLLISSPYNNPGHYLDLADLDVPNLIIAKALTALKAVRPDYATAEYTSSLNLDRVIQLVRQFSKDEAYEWKEVTFYVVVFRSKLKENIDNDLLYKLDYESHREACESGGLLKYWFGKPNEERRNLATCFWRSREDARVGGLGPWHAKARAAGRVLYESIVFSTHRFTIHDGAAAFTFEDWKD